MNIFNTFPVFHYLHIRVVSSRNDIIILLKKYRVRKKSEVQKSKFTVSCIQDFKKNINSSRQLLFRLSGHRSKTRTADPQNTLANQPTNNPHGPVKQNFLQEFNIRTRKLYFLRSLRISSVSKNLAKIMLRLY